ncbi:MAG: endolytic transglycosylase MltG [Clostridia bacterium]|nr:endolytic transglycosylase MltG [Clostridia bacterium]
MSDNMNMDNRDNMQNEEVQRYRQERVNQFRLNIQEEEGAKPTVDSDFSDEITSFSDETTKAQIERASKKELRRQKKEEKKVLKIKADRNKKVYRMAWLAIVIIMSVVVSQFLIVGSNDFLAITRVDESEATVKVTADDTVDTIADKLEEAGVIDAPEFFVLFSDITGKGQNIDPGVYRVPKNKDYLGILNYMSNTSNRQTTITLQITEGTSILELSQQLYEAGVTYDVDEFLRLCNSDEFDDEYGFISSIEPDEKRVYKLEGYMFPDTYEFYVDEAPDITIRRFLANFETKIYETEHTVEGYSKPVTLSQLVSDSDYTLDEIVTMASLVQGEAANVEDMYNISSVINNRLEYGSSHDIHSLGLDCTAFYPYSDAESIPEDIKETFSSDYETYDTAGLPPGAVCSASADAFLAALVPNDTDYLYFCHGTDADGNVTAYYASSFSEHQNNLYKAGLVR